MNQIIKVKGRYVHMYRNGLCSLDKLYSSLVCVHNYPKHDETLITWTVYHKLSEVLSGSACSSSGKVSYECV